MQRGGAYGAATWGVPAGRWLGEHFTHLGERSTLDPAKIFYPEREVGADGGADG